MVIHVNRASRKKSLPSLVRSRRSLELRLVFGLEMTLSKLSEVSNTQPYRLGWLGLASCYLYCYYITVLRSLYLESADELYKSASVYVQKNSKHITHIEVSKQIDCFEIVND